MSIRWLYSHRTLVALLATATLAVAVMTLLVIRQQQDHDNGQVYLEAGGSAGSHPFVPLVVPPTAPAGSPARDGVSFQVAASTDGRATCDPEKLISYLAGDQRASEAWVRALNYDRTLSWSGGSRIETQQIPAYIHELTPRLLAEDLRVTNYQFTNGVALPVQSILEKGTAILVDAKGIARVRCACGNPLTPMVQLKVPPVYRGQPWPNFRPQRVATQPGQQCGDGRCAGPAAPPSDPAADQGGPSEAQHWQDNPGRPDEPQHAEKPEPAGRPGPPGGLERPVKSEHPVDAEHREYPITRDKTVNPDKSEEAEKAEKPGTAQNLKQSEDPQKSDKIAHSADLEQSSRTSRPSESQHSAKPEYPSKMKDPGKAGGPGDPAHAANPAFSTAEEQHDRAQQRAGQPAPPDDVAHTDNSRQPAQPTPSHQDKTGRSGSTEAVPTCAGHGTAQSFSDGGSGCSGSPASGATGTRSQP